jgi:RNA polymerase sigma-70 factor, ECF subfamily
MPGEAGRAYVSVVWTPAGGGVFSGGGVSFRQAETDRRSVPQGGRVFGRGSGKTVRRAGIVWDVNVGPHGGLEPATRLHGSETGATDVNSVSAANVNIAELALVDAAARGDREARRALFERYREVAYRVALRITRREADALDVVQDAFIRAFERLADFQRESGFQTWLLRIVSNRALDLLRARRVRLAVSIEGGGDDDAPGPSLAGAPAAPERGLEQQELAARLHRALDELPPEQRAVFALFATGELTYGQIAEAVGIPIGTVMSRLYHARRRLHELLPDLAPPEAVRSG